MRLMLYNAVCFLLYGTFMVAQEKSIVIEKRIYITKAINDEPPEVDGILDDDAWEIVEWAGDFIEWRPDENTAPGQQTQFKIIYDQKFIYIGVQCLDQEPDQIVKRMSRRDGFEGDWIEINFDSYHDKRTGFSFNVNAAGVKGDEFISNNGNNWDASWNPIWYVKTQIDDRGWFAEMKIPLSQLRFGKMASQIWGLQVNRRLFRAEERSIWQRIPLDAPGWVSEFGELHGLIDLKPQKQLEIQPYTVASLETYPEEAGDPFNDGEDFVLNGGLDAKIGITNDLTLDLTVNPDFGQVEADPAAIALDGFQLFFREQRPFFVENKNIFDYQFADGDDNIFYSRRIGRNPQRELELEDGDFADLPNTTKILGAAKFSGKTKKGWSIGVLETITSKEFASITTNGVRGKEIVEPMTNYFVGRLQKDFNQRNSFLGGIFTATHRNIEEGLGFLHKAAYTGGLDFKHNWKDRTYYIEGNLVASHITGSPEAIGDTQNSLTHLFDRVDASHVSVDTTRTSLTGSGGRLEFGRAGSGNWSYEAGVNWKSPELELNDIGFLRQADEIRQYAEISYRTLRSSKKLRRFYMELEQLTTYDFEGNYNRIQYETRTEVNFLNNWWAEGGLGYKPRIFTNTALRGGPRFRFSDELFNYTFFGSDSRKKLRFFAGYVISGAKQNHFSFFRVRGGLTYQPTNALRVSVEPEFRKNTNKTQYISEEDFDGIPRYITGNIGQQTLSASIRLNYNINPNMTIQYYGQPFISKGVYSGLNYITDAVADNLDHRFKRYNAEQLSYDIVDEVYSVDENRNGNTDYTIDNPDFAFVQFRSNLVFRWEYIPGSEVFLVWSQGTTGNGNPADHLFESLNNQILGQQPENIFLIKATYRFLF